MPQKVNNKKPRLSATSKKSDSSEKLQKILARTGLGSRREIEKVIEAGRVSVNGKIVKLGARASAQDTIRVDGKIISHKHTPRTRVLMYHKPVGEICSHKESQCDNPSVFENLPSLRYGRWIMVGRLDLNTSGLLLFTNDGELANRLMHPRHQVEREYAVRIFGKVDQAMLNVLKKGVELEDGLASFDEIVDAGGQGRNHWYHVVLREGRNREVRRLWESQGVNVSRLTRVRFANITLPRWLRQGKYQDLKPQQIESLCQLVNN